ncbi:hypothetical protein Tco_1501993 [Tanacetum coccineum]
MGKYSHRFHHKPAKFNKLLLHDLGNRDHQKNYADVRRKPLEFQVVGISVERSDTFRQMPKVEPSLYWTFQDEIHIDDKLNFIKEPVEIMDREVKRLKQSHIPIVKVRWNTRRGSEFTWEREDR